MWVCFFVCLFAFFLVVTKRKSPSENKENILEYVVRWMGGEKKNQDVLNNQRNVVDEYCR